MAKDRLDDLIKARNRRNGDIQVEIQEEAEPLTGGANLRQTFERAEVLRQWIESVEQNIEAVRGYVKKVDDIKVNQQDLNDKIECLFQNNTSIFHKIQAKLKSFEEEIKNGDFSSAEGRIKNIQFNTLKTRYQKIFKQNTSELENYRDLKRSQLEAQLRAKGVKVTDEELTQLLEGGTDIQVFTENFLVEVAEAKRVLQDLEDRQQQLIKIERMLEEVRDLFLQMAILIDNQQELIDRVEYQADMAQNFIGKGKQDLNKAEHKRKKYLKRKVILIICVVLLLALILALILK